MTIIEEHREQELEAFMEQFHKGWNDIDADSVKVGQVAEAFRAGYTSGRTAGYYQGCEDGYYDCMYEHKL